MGEALRGRPDHGGEGRRAVARGALRGTRGARRAIVCTTAFLAFLGAPEAARASHPASRPVVLASGAPQQDAPIRIDRGRFTVVCYPTEEKLANSLLARSLATDSFPGLPRPTHHLLIAIAPDSRRFREWAGSGAPEWGAALAFPDSRRIVMQGRSAGSDAGDPFEVLRHELAHLALHEFLGDLAPRWFDEGYASYSARELVRNEALATNVALAIRGTPSFDELDNLFTQGATSAQAAYALAYRAVDDMASIDPKRGLTLLFENWKTTGSLDRAMRQAFGMTLESYEHDWQNRTRQRYGGLALFSDFTLASLVVMLMIAPFYIARRRRDRSRMAALLAAESALMQNDDAILDVLLDSAPESDPTRQPDEEKGPAAGPAGG